MPGEGLIFLVGTVLGLGFAAFKISQVSWRFLVDYLNGNLQRDKDGQIEDEKARQNVEKIKEAGWFAIIGIIGGPVLIVLVLVGPILILGAMAVGAIYLLGCSIFKK